jgi:hypothetical protein
LSLSHPEGEKPDLPQNPLTLVQEKPDGSQQYKILGTLFSTPDAFRPAFIASYESW